MTTMSSASVNQRSGRFAIRPPEVFVLRSIMVFTVKCYAVVLILVQTDHSCASLSSRCCDAACDSWILLTLSACRCWACSTSALLVLFVCAFC